MEKNWKNQSLRITGSTPVEGDVVNEDLFKHPLCNQVIHHSLGSLVTVN